MDKKLRLRKRNACINSNKYFTKLQSSNDRFTRDYWRSKFVFSVRFLMNESEKLKLEDSSNKILISAFGSNMCSMINLMFFNYFFFEKKIRFKLVWGIPIYCFTIWFNMRNPYREFRNFTITRIEDEVLIKKFKDSLKKYNN